MSYSGGVLAENFPKFPHARTIQTKGALLLRNVAQHTPTTHEGQGRLAGGSTKYPASFPPAMSSSAGPIELTLLPPFPHETCGHDM